MEAVMLLEAIREKQGELNKEMDELEERIKKQKDQEWKEKLNKALGSQMTRYLQLLSKEIRVLKKISLSCSNQPEILGRMRNGK